MDIKNHDLLMELHRTALEMWKIAWPYLAHTHTQDSDKFIAARMRHQDCLAKLAGKEEEP